MATFPLLALLLGAGPACTPGSEFEPPLCPTRLPRVTAIRVSAQGVVLWKEIEPAFPCRRFRLNEAHVRRYLRDARQADRAAVHYTLAESNCAVRGTVRFADGTDGQWQIDRYALGWLDRPGHARMTLYCRGCEGAPWGQ
ncbi:hypothetical protein [Sphingomonas endolithica]|uniref:hypothetical protein n=1 Tax=Sphingomonas endolithica TaxID=2972485 RepID=UPI0021AE8E04|nr:hypothetical protein [Sphingomonas sp. ZFBP2030]